MFASTTGLSLLLWKQMEMEHALYMLPSGVLYRLRVVCGILLMLVRETKSGNALHLLGKQSDIG